MDRDILQINATVIAGAFIFLTISTIDIIPSTDGSEELKRHTIQYLIFPAVVIVIFSISSHRAIVGDKEWALWLMKWGFIATTFAAVGFVALNLESYIGPIPIFPNSTNSST